MCWQHVCVTKIFALDLLLIVNGNGRSVRFCDFFKLTKTSEGSGDRKNPEEMIVTNPPSKGRARGRGRLPNPDELDFANLSISNATGVSSSFGNSFTSSEASGANKAAVSYKIFLSVIFKLLTALYFR